MSNEKFQTNLEKAKLLKTLGLNIKILRIKKGLKQKQLASKVGIHNSYMCKIELGRVDIGISLLEKIAYALGDEIGTFYNGLRR